MKNFSFLLCFLPVFAFAQVKKSKPAVSKKTATKTVKNTAVTKPVATAEGFRLNGTLAGVSDGTILKLLNANNGAEEQSTTVQKGKFAFSGKMASPDFKLIGVSGQPPFITVFLDNSNVVITAKKDSMEAAKITGSASHNDFAEFSRYTKPYEQMLQGVGKYDVAFMEKGARSMENFITNKPASFVTPLAIYRYNQLTGDYLKLESMYNALSPTVKETQVGKYLEQQVNMNKQIPYGQPLADFTQPDTAGANISLSAFKGKYVLVDFWASWCGPCRAENPNVVNTYEKFKDKNFTVLGVSLDKTKQAWIDAIGADHLTWTHVSDLKAWGNSVAQQFSITGIPANFLLDPQGNLIGKNLRGAALEYRLSQVMR